MQTFINLPCGPSHLARTISATIDPCALKYFPTSEVIRIELDTSLAMGFVVHHLAIVNTKL